MGTSKTWVMLGERTSEEVSYERAAALRKRGIEYVQAEIRRIDAAKREAETSRGVWRGDYLVIALGADMDMGLIPGLSEAVHTFYTLEGAVRLREALKDFRGGRVVLPIPRTLFKCPSAPYETAFLLEHKLKMRGLQDRAHLTSPPSKPRRWRRQAREWARSFATRCRNATSPSTRRSAQRPWMVGGA